MDQDSDSTSKTHASFKRQGMPSTEDSPPKITIPLQFSNKFAVCRHLGGGDAPAAVSIFEQ